jgi:iron(III) transport system ATP-binding protein
MLARLELIDLAERYPFQISGGQQQRVAIARALVYRAELMLLDEPLSNLDTQLRERARAWLASVHAEFGLTTVLVTHDQGEALSLSDRVVLLSRGRVAQDGSPTDVYDAPRSAYVADFVGGANLIKAKVISVEEKNGSNAVEVETVEGVRLRATSETAIDAGSSVQVVIRPHRIQIGAPGTLAGEGSSVVPFKAKTVLYQGAAFEIIGDTPIGPLRVIADRRPDAGVISAIIPWEDCRTVPWTPTA